MLSMHVADDDNFASLCDKVLSVSDVFVCGFCFLVKYLLRGCLGD